MPRLTRPVGQPWEVQRVVEILRNAARAEILRSLARGPLTTAEVAEAAGSSRVSAHRHLALLEDAGLVVADRDLGARIGQGATRWSLNSDGARAVAACWVDYVTGTTNVS